MSSYNYVETVNSNLICCVCRAPFIEPVITTTCSHTFCRECISKSLELQPCCPIDRSPLKPDQLRPENLLVRNMVDELMVECTNRPLGCMHTCQRQHLEAHLQHSCQYVKVLCAEEGCDKTILRKDVGKHTHDCTHRVITCEGCGNPVKAIDIDAHNRECAAQDTACPHCDLELQRSQLGEHSKSCPQFPIACPFAPYGCPWSDARKNLEDIHRPQCVYNALNGFFTVYEEQMTKLRDENALLRQRLERTDNAIQGLRREINIARYALGPWWRPENGNREPNASRTDSAAAESRRGVEGITVTTTTSTTSTPRATATNGHSTTTAFSFDPSSRRGASLSAIMASFPDSPVLGTDSDDLEYDRDPHSPVSNSSHTEASFLNHTLPRDPLLAPANALHHPGARSFPPLLRFPEMSGVHAGRSGFSTHTALHPSSTAVAPIDLSSTVEGALSSLRGSIVALSASIDSLGRRQDIALTTENLRMNEEVGALRAVVHGLRMQVHSLITERNGTPWVPNDTGPFYRQFHLPHPPMSMNAPTSTTKL